MFLSEEQSFAFHVLLVHLFFKDSLRYGSKMLVWCSLSHLVITKYRFTEFQQIVSYSLEVPGQSKSSQTDQLWALIRQDWVTFIQVFVQKLILSMPQQTGEIIKKRCHNHKYCLFAWIWLFVCFFAKELFEAYEMIVIIFHYIIETNGKMYETQNSFLCQNVCLDHKHYTHTLTLQKQWPLYVCVRGVYESVCVCVLWYCTMC